MLIYSVTAALVFSLISHKFYQDDNARKDEIQAWLFIAFAASIWPITLPNIVRKATAKSRRHQSVTYTFRQPTRPFLTYEALQKPVLK